jgi:hypothetical protein
MHSVYRRLSATNANVQVRCIRVHSVKSIKIHVNIRRVKMAFVNRSKIALPSVAKSIIACRIRATIMVSVQVWPRALFARVYRLTPVPLARLRSMPVWLRPVWTIQQVCVQQVSLILRRVLPISTNVYFIMISVRTEDNASTQWVVTIVNANNSIKVKIVAFPLILVSVIHVWHRTRFLVRRSWRMSSWSITIVLAALAIQVEWRLIRMFECLSLSCSRRRTLWNGIEPLP